MTCYQHLISKISKVHACFQKQTPGALSHSLCRAAALCLSGPGVDGWQWAARGSRGEWGSAGGLQAGSQDWMVDSELGAAGPDSYQPIGVGGLQDGSRRPDGWQGQQSWGPADGMGGRARHTTSLPDTESAGRAPATHPVRGPPAQIRVPPIQPGAFPFSRREPQTLLFGGLNVFL